ncbi:glycosyltransferase family 2 protein [Profundibacterium mesophilum]|uniref:Glycosyltransferase like family 2domain containing protein n=1 Tax=Profundibacterium mesophilum KAUST100406-0324 TaxID=1037889 RepID=A0A921NR48_9RHOB|nr:glycosyltransferase [Profundibacterium mesophilum]KAF0676055.1 Glycosyltransferase like family 2domain containing protein [Profundibacterium mesophilum KAUST100406-0324]
MTDIAIAIPATNEEDLIGAALRSIAVAARQCSGHVGVLVLANNCTDGTARLTARHGGEGAFTLKVVETTLPPERRDAGRARRMAMQAACQAWPDAGLLFTTDADSELSPMTLAAIERAARHGAAVICGRIETSLPAAMLATPSIRRINEIEGQYRPLVHEMRHALDIRGALQLSGPCPHYIESGACMGLTRDLHERLGGLPDIRAGEDRQLVREAERIGATVRYSTQALARVSPRIAGRAPGGMAEALRGRLSDPDPQADPLLRSAADLAADWSAAQTLGPSLRPPLLNADPPLRASDLERDLPALRTLVETAIRPLTGRVGRRAVA